MFFKSQRIKSTKYIHIETQRNDEQLKVSWEIIVWVDEAVEFIFPRFYYLAATSETRKSQIVKPLL